MSTGRIGPGPAEHLDARRRFLAAVMRGDGLEGLLADAYAQHPRNNTFPGEVYLAIGADVLILAGCSPTDRLSQEGLVAAWLPEARYRGRENNKIRYAVMACASRAGGLDVDLLDEVSWWSGDYYQYAAAAALALIRACADRLGEDVTTLARRLVDQPGAAEPSTGVAGR